MVGRGGRLWPPDDFPTTVSKKSVKWQEARSLESERASFRQNGQPVSEEF